MGFRKPGEGASGTRSPCTAALELSLRNLPPRQPSNPSRQLAGQPATLGILDRPQTVLGSWQACLFSSPVPGLPLLFLWASESNVRHFGPPSNPSQRLWPTPASQPGEGASGTCSPCTAALELSLRNLPPRQPSNPSRQLAGQPATLGILDRPQTVLGSWQACLFSSPVPGLPLLFLWASESNVRHFGPASNPSQRLWPTPASQPCLRQAGAWGGSLWNVQPVHCSLRTEPPEPATSAALKPFSAAGRPASNVRHFGPPPNRSRQACLFSSPVPGLPLLFLWTSESNVRHFGPPPAPLAYSCVAAWGGSLWNVQPVHCSLRTEPPEPATSAALKPFSAAGRPASNVRHFGPPPNRSRQLAGLPLLFACSRPASSVLMGFRKVGEGASGTCSPCTAALELSLRNLPPRQPSNPSRQLAGQLAFWTAPQPFSAAGRPASSLRLFQACLFCSYGLLKATLSILARLQTLPSAFGLLLRRSLACVRREPGEGASGTRSPCTAALELSLRNLPPRQPSNPSRQLAGQPATLGILDRPQTVLGSWQACLFSSPVPGLPLLFLWASESNVRHFGPPENPSQRLWPTPASQPCLRQAGAWGGSLWNVQPVHCSLRTEPPEPATSAALKPFSAAGRPASNVRHFGPPPTVLGSWQACLFSSPVPGLPLLFLWASESNVRHFGPPSNPSQRLWPTPASQPCLRQAGAWGGSLWNVQPVHCSLRTEPPEPATSAALKPFSAAGRPASNVRPCGPPPNRSRQLAGLPLLFACSKPASSVLMGFRKQR